MPLPDYQTLMFPLLQVASEGETSVPLAETQIVGRLGITPEECAQILPSGKQRVLHNRIHWAKFYLTKAGLLAGPKRGRFVITPEGQRILDNPPKKLDTQYLLSIPCFRSFFYSNVQEGTHAPAAIETPSAQSITTPEETIELAYNTVLAVLRTDLLDRILQSSATFFERVIVDLLVAMGYGGSQRNAAKQLGKSGDGGVDGVINEDVLGLDRVYVQAKRYSPGSSVGRPEIQAFTGSLVGLGASKGVFVTTSAFSNQAIEYAERIPQRVVLIDGKRLTELMVEHSVGVRSSRLIEFKRLDEDFFSED